MQVKGSLQHSVRLSPVLRLEEDNTYGDDCLGLAFQDVTIQIISL